MGALRMDGRVSGEDESGSRRLRRAPQRSHACYCARPRLFQEVNAIHGGTLSRHLARVLFPSVTALQGARSHLLPLTAEVQRLQLSRGFNHWLHIWFLVGTAF